MSKLLRIPLHLWTFGLKSLEVVGQTSERLLQVDLQVLINAFTLVIQSDESPIDAFIAMLHRDRRFALASGGKSASESRGCLTA